MSTLLPVAIFNLGAPEAIVIGIIALLLFGPRLPQVMRSLGKGIVEFKKGIRDTENQVNREIDTQAEQDPKKQIDQGPSE